MFNLPIMNALCGLTADELNDAFDRSGTPPRYYGTRSNTKSSLDVIDIIGQVSESSIESQMKKLQDFGTRYIYSNQCNLSAEYIYNEFDKIGTLDVDYDFFEYNNYTLRNVIATLYGLNASKPIYIICAHYDSISNLSENDPDAPAPGADDDASGVAAILEAAKILSNYTFSSTIKFIAFSGEEQGLVGSKHYVNNLPQSTDLGCVFNIEMIGYSPSGLAGEPEIDIIGNLESEWMIDYMNSINLNYKIGLNIDKVIDPGFRQSDYVPFWDAGYAAVCTAGESDMKSEGFNPYFHTSEDTIDKLNLTLTKKAIQLIVAALTTLTNELYIDLNISPFDLTFLFLAILSMGVLTILLILRAKKTQIAATKKSITTFERRSSRIYFSRKLPDSDVLFTSSHARSNSLLLKWL